VDSYLNLFVINITFTGEEVLTSAEKENLPFAGKLMAYIMGLRFLVGVFPMNFICV